MTGVEVYGNILNGLVLNGCLVHDGASSRGSDDGYVGTPQAALIRRKSSTIGVGRIDYIQFPLPPNRTEPAVLPHTDLRSVGFPKKGTGTADGASPPFRKFRFQNLVISSRPIRAIRFIRGSPSSHFLQRM